MKLTTAPRRITRADLADPSATPAEWWLAMAMKSPLDHRVDDYEETSFPPGSGERPNVTAFGRDYECPWLVKSIVVRGQRLADNKRLRDLAEKALERFPVAGGSADAGAALCVLAYADLAGAATDAARVDSRLSQIDAYCALRAANPNVLRWQVSLRFAAACLMRRCGRRADAAAQFRLCASIDVGTYSPILGTKTVDALLQAGLIAAADGDDAAAAVDWRGAIEAAERLLRADWGSFVGDRGFPLAFGLREATDLLDLTARAGQALRDLPQRSRRPGRFWELQRFGLRPSIELLERVIADLRRWEASMGEQLLAARTQVQAEQDAGPGDSAAEIEALRRTVAIQAVQIANLERMRGLKGALRGLADRLRR
jgi:hypothetical protein